MKIALWVLYGLAAGSFANVYFYRILRNLSLWKPGSFCPGCNHSIRWVDNIPVLSYLLLQGKCRNCQSKISLRYPMIEILCSFLFIALSVKFRDSSMLELAAFSIFALILFLIGGIDYLTYLQSNKQYGIIPDHLIILLGICGIFFMFHNPFFKEKFWLGLLGGFSGILIMFLIRLIGTTVLQKEALGWGDIKMVGAIGFWTGWQGVFFTLVLSSLAATLVSLALIRLKKLDATSSIPYAPFLSLGAFSALYFL